MTVTSDLASFDADWEALGLPKASPKTRARACSGNGGLRPCTRKGMSAIPFRFHPPND